MSTISKIIKKIRFFFALFIIIISALLLTLINGIKIDNFHSNIIDIEKLYIKLDKKLIVNLKNLEIHKQKNQKKSNKELLDISNNIIWLNRLFKEINIENLTYGEVSIKLLYKDNIFYIDTPRLTINTVIENKNKILIVSAKEIKFKDYNVTIWGDFKADIIGNKYSFLGNFTSYELSGKLYLNLNNDILDYYVFDTKADSLKNFIENLAIKTNLDEEIKNWIYGYIIAKEYVLYEFGGKINLNNLEYYPKQMYAKARAKDPVVKFHQNATPAVAEFVDVTLKNDTLSFALSNPKFKDKSINGSSVNIYNLLTQNSHLVLNLKTNSLLDKDIHEILKAYEIDFPVSQDSGKMDANLTLDINFDPFFINSYGEFKVENSNIDINGAKFYSKQGLIYLKDNIIDIKNSDLKNNIFEATASGVIDTNTSNAKFGTYFNNICINECKVLDIKDQNATVNLDFSDEVKLSSPELNFNMNITKKTINLTNLANLKKSSQIMQELGIEDANLSLKTDDFSKFNINLTGTKFDMSLQKRDGTPYKEDDFSINLNKDINITSKSELMKFDISGSLIKAYFKDLILVVDKNMSNQNDQKDIKFFATNSALYLKDSNRTISFDKFSGSITKNELVFDGNNSFDSNIRVIKKNGDLKIFGQNLSSGFANDFLGLNSFNEGNFTIKLYGKDFDTFQSEIKVKNTYLSSYKFYQKFLSFINSVPSLLIFKVPDFNDKGFTVNDGVMFIERDNNKLNIKALNLTGSSADIAGRGSIDLDSKDVNIDFELKLLKDASSIISKIPLVGHIFLGDDKTISTVIGVRGTLDEPKFETQIIKDIIKTPYNIIKNTLQLPFTIFD
ncbi:DUF3971 domain-containing protein [Campylobacter hyointestinalis subsp. hyointestinalis]|uniref:YhdP family protein n=1 Tax=Campylobacter hyointestinalis TaxID=198 RepID=UPI000CE4BBDA|nr:AsmA-like C-terminal domain-containing protein [Campylobacter hyointestinalis]PPB70191.1 DUF3971 domain-containing protein [Campylobacter hyointestinalis subsp. hyointestinalis]